MANLDVSEVVSDPDFADDFVVTRQPETVNNFGESTTPANQTIKTFGTVTMANPDDLLRLPEGDRSDRTISIVTQFRLQAASPGIKADIVTWRGNNYLVKLVDPYVQFGAGQIQAICGSIDTQQAAPSDMGSGNNG